MSVKRYTNGADDDQGTILPFMEESPNGDYVEYADYARLQAEVERLMQEYSDATNHYNKLHNDLQAEVERLRFAGDMLAFALAHGDRMEYGCASDPIEEYLDRKEIKEWNAAKEGKPIV